MSILTGKVVSITIASDLTHTTTCRSTPTSDGISVVLDHRVSIGRRGRVPRGVRQRGRVANPAAGGGVPLRSHRDYCGRHGHGHRVDRLCVARVYGLIASVDVGEGPGREDRTSLETR